MNKTTYFYASLFFCAALLMCLTHPILHAQNNWDIRLSRSALFCESNQICYDLQLKSGNSNNWHLGDQNYRLLFDGELMSITSVVSLLNSNVYGNAQIDQNLKFTGVGQEPASPLDDIDDHLGFLDFSIIQTDKSAPANAALIQPTNYTSVAEICVEFSPTVVTDNECLSFYHSRPATAGSITNQYTNISENNAPGNTVSTVSNTFEDLTPADGPPNACPEDCRSGNTWNVHLEQSNLDCAGNTICYSLQISNGASGNWALGDQNYRLFFDGDLMTVNSVTSLLPGSHYAPAVIDQNLKFSGVGQDAASPLDDIDDNLGFLDFSIIQSDKSNPAGAVQITDTDSTAVAEICLTLDPSVLSDPLGNTCLSFYHSRPETAGNITNQYTTVSENNAPGSTAPTTARLYNDLTSEDNAAACPGPLCNSETKWDIRFNRSTVDCTEDEVCYRVELKSTDAGDWVLSDQNYRLFFNGDLMTVTSVTSLLPVSHYSAANIDQNLKFTGVGQDAASPLDDIDDHLGFLDFSIIQTDKNALSGSISISDDYLATAEICVAIDKSVVNGGDSCISFYHSRPETAGTFTNQFTTISENDVSGSTTPTSGTFFNDLSCEDISSLFPVALSDSFMLECPGESVSYGLSGLFETGNSSGIYSVITQPDYGDIQMFFDGNFIYRPDTAVCGTDQFDYQICDAQGCCDTATVVLTPNTQFAPQIHTMPRDTTITCENLIPNPPIVIASDECSFISMQFFEISDQEASGCKRYSYQIERTWTLSDYCNNKAYVNQTIAVIDTTPPNFTVPPNILVGCLDDIDDLLLVGDVTDESDNCSVNLQAIYTDSPIPSGCNAGYSVFRTWALADDCGNQTQKVQTITVRPERIAFNLKVMLQGALINTDGTLMRDDLRKAELVPLTEPYSQIGGFQHIDSGGEEIEESLLLIEGNDAIVDWLFLEIRHPFVLDSIIATRSVLLQRDGDVINSDGSSLLVFSGLVPGIYHIAVRHRNHLGIMTKSPIPFSDDAIPIIDFSSLQSDTWGTNPQAEQLNYAALWSGDLNRDKNSIYQGPNNDLTSILLTVLSDSDNIFSNANFIKQAYHPADLDLNGDVIFQGPDNDKAKLLFYSILKHPGNVNLLANFINQEQLPKPD